MAAMPGASAFAIRQGARSAGFRQELQADDSRESASQNFLVTAAVRRTDAFRTANRSTVSSIGNRKKGLQPNADGSVDVYFWPKAPSGKESNWVQTVPSKSWNVILRLYGPLEPWFDKTWRPGDIEEVK
jgi:hypothetical protein